MPNLRIIYDNAADRAATLTASTTSGSLVASNMLTNNKGIVHRSTGTSVTYTLTWNSNQIISGLVLPCTNLSSTSLIRVRLYSDTAGTTLVKDSGTISASTVYNVTSLFGSLNANTFAYGGLTKTSVWFTSAATNARRCVIDLTDTSNPSGYIDCSRIVLGDYWSPKYNFEPGLLNSLVDNSVISRSDSGDLVVDQKPVNDKLSFNFSYLPETDYLDLIKILTYVGTTRNIAVSMLPGYDAKGAEDSYIIYGKRSNNEYTYAVHKYYKSQLEIEGW